MVDTFFAAYASGVDTARECTQKIALGIVACSLVDFLCVRAFTWLATQST